MEYKKNFYIGMNFFYYPKLHIVLQTDHVEWTTNIQVISKELNNC